jgi:hypothetical protein
MFYFKMWLGLATKIFCLCVALPFVIAFHVSNFVLKYIDTWYESASALTITAMQKLGGDKWRD